MEMNILVVGCGKVGSRLAQVFDRYGHDVSVIDANAANFRQLGEDFGGMTFTGVPMDMSVLRSAGVESCDAVAVATPDDNLNITVSQIVCEFFGVKNVVARITDPSREKVFTHFGLKTVCPTSLGCSAMFTAIMQPWEEKHVTFGTSTVSVSVKDVEKSQVGRRLQSIATKAGECISGVVHEDGSISLYDGRQDIVLLQGDKILCSRVSD